MKQDFFAFGIDEAAFVASAATFKENVKKTFEDIQTSVAGIQFTPTMGSGLTALTTSAGEAASAMAKVTKEFEQTVVAAQEVQNILMTTKSAFDEMKRVQVDLSVATNQMANGNREANQSIKQYHDALDGLNNRITQLAKTETSGAEAATQAAIKRYENAISLKQMASEEDKVILTKQQLAAAEEVLVAALAQETSANYEYAAALTWVSEAADRLNNDEVAYLEHRESSLNYYQAAEAAERAALTNKEQATTKV